MTGRMVLRGILLLLLAGLFVAPACGPGGDAPDDDDGPNDDDATDDDDLSDDDDDSAVDVLCDGSLPIILESEENGLPELANPVGELPNAGFCIQGDVQCGDHFYEDLDLFGFVLPLDREVRFELIWGGEADFDR
ncbi:MAG: hypothetical protein VX498_09230 [Myxococcota bacterium]|nr:hypothetical protein [Myxococcota bacterium]